LVKTVETDDNGMPSQAGGINGGIFKRSSACDMKLWNNYVNVESLDATMDHAKKTWCKINAGKLAVPGEGWYAILTDPQAIPLPSASRPKCKVRAPGIFHRGTIACTALLL